MSRIITDNIAGNVHEVAAWVNRHGWADELVQIDYRSGGRYSVVVLRLPDKWSHFKPRDLWNGKPTGETA